MFVLEMFNGLKRWCAKSINWGRICPRKFSICIEMSQTRSDAFGNGRNWCTQTL